jgi:predicted amidophosphoribosyltransferase
MVARAVEVLGKVVARGELAGFFGPTVTLVPAPRSSPLEPGWLWPAERICREMVAAGLAKDVLPCLKRTRKVPKSASASRGERPTAQTHLESMEIDVPSLLGPSSVTVVDDVVTKGATLLACASHVRKSLPEIPVHVFGLVRTQGLADDVGGVVAPCTGTIEFNGIDVRRSP